MSCIGGADQRLVLESSLLAKAQEGILSGDYGADRWYETKKRTVERLSELVVILKNEKVEDGALVRLYIPDEHTALKTGFRGRREGEPIRN